MTRLNMASPCENCSITDNHLIKEKTTIPRIWVKTSSNNLDPSCVSDHSIILAYAHRANKLCQCFCGKKVGLFEFRCRCSGRYCQTHRFPEKRECIYLYRGAGRKYFLKETQICKLDKLQARVWLIDEST